MQTCEGVRRRFEQGMTLVELMIAITLGLVLTAGIIQVFIGNNQSYKLQNASGSVQESGRFAMNFLEKDVRMAGFVGCAEYGTVNIKNDVVSSSNPSPTLDIMSTVGSYVGPGAVRGYTYNGSFPGDLAILGLTSSQVVQGTDILVVQSAAACPGGNVVCDNSSVGSSTTCPDGSTINPGQYEIANNSICNVQQDDIVLISDCQNADIHQVTNSPALGLNALIAADPTQLRGYGNGASLYMMNAVVYYVGFNASGQPALFRHRFLGNAYTVSSPLGTANSDEELVDGVYSMAIYYGVDTDGDKLANQYITASAFTSPAGYPSCATGSASSCWNSASTWDNVVTVRITLSTRSPQDNVVAQSSAYTYNGGTVTDRRLRRTYTTTIALRNRI